MTRWSFRALAALFALGALAGSWSALWAWAPTARPVEMTCEEWLRAPRAGELRLTGCVADTSRSTFLRWEAATVEIVRADDGPRLYAETDDARARGHALRLELDSSAAERLRTLERHAGALRVTVTLEGRVTRGAPDDDARRIARAFPRRFDDERDYVLVREPPRSRFGVHLALAFGLACAAALALLVWRERRWTARGDALRDARAGSPRPVRF